MRLIIVPVLLREIDILRFFEWLEERSHGFNAKVRLLADAYIFDEVYLVGMRLHLGDETLDVLLHHVKGCPDGVDRVRQLA